MNLPSVTIHAGAISIDGKAFPTTGWTMTAEPGDSYATLRLNVPLFDITEPDAAGTVLVYVASLQRPDGLIEREADTPVAALRALADALEAAE